MQTLALDSKNIFGSDGSGNQIKSWINSRFLIKVNSKYREASKEVDAYKLGTALGLDCAKYEQINVMFRGEKRVACITESFLLPDEIELTVAEILDTMQISIPMNMSAKSFIDITVKAINTVTSISVESVYTWVYNMLVFDYIICNDDRHLTNFELLFNPNTNTYRFAPYYDHGESFLRTDSYLSLENYTKLLRKFKAKPFSTNPDRNIGDYNRALQSFETLIGNIGGAQNINNIGISSGHLAIVKRRIERLKKMLY